MHVSNNQAFEERAIFLAAVCGQTYAQFNHADGSFTIPAGYSVTHTIQAKSLGQVWERFGFIIESPEEIIIAFRGSSSTANWISNANATQKKFKYIQEDCLTHRGFTNIYTSARSGIHSALSRLSSGKRLYITGHSLGGALATLCAPDVAANTSFSTPHLYTYGSPRVGDPAFAKASTRYLPNSHRIANLFDSAAYVPPSIFKLPKRDKRYYYSHVREFCPLSFQKGSVSLNHALSSYFEELSMLRPEFTRQLCTSNPDFCPVLEVPPQAANRA
ncbi:lipase family protein [Paenibacillus riograndensis]|uniref:Lipase class 3 n=1 Tax=Paenibacillus riograndensis SBR5 TaxID=1073571 RepID=A0A0E4HBL2_9BACL|nr:lipase family protein [Paenibacillus riograndensis]CQR56615.1 lipase class 3 [Paenibacillus riograndensis SBR5]